MESAFKNPNYPPLTTPEGMDHAMPDPMAEAKKKAAMAMAMQQMGSQLQQLGGGGIPAPREHAKLDIYGRPSGY